jgi:hypothetical protein
VFWALLSTVLLAFCWFWSLRTILIAAGVVTVVGVMSSVLLRRQRMRLARIAASREGECICQFARSFDRRSVDTWVIRAIYETLQRELSFAHPSFPIRASDRLDELLSDADDLDMEIAPEVARRSLRRFDNLADNPYYGKVQTVADLVVYFNVHPKEVGHDSR